MAGLPEPQTAYALLIGVAEYDDPFHKPLPTCYRSVCWPSHPSTSCSARRLRQQRRPCSTPWLRRTRSRAATAIGGSVFARCCVADASFGCVVFGRGRAGAPIHAFVKTRQPGVAGGEAEVNQPQFRRRDLLRPPRKLRAALAIAVAVDHIALAVVRAVRPRRKRGRWQQVANRLLQKTLSRITVLTEGNAASDPHI